MVLSLARVYGRKLTPAVARDLALTFGAAVLGRRLFYYLANLVPVAGWALGTGVAAGTTMALGYGIATWLATGQKISQDGYRGLAEDITRSLLKSIKNIPDRRSAGKSIPSIVADAWTDIGSMTAAEPDSAAHELHNAGQP